MVITATNKNSKRFFPLLNFVFAGNNHNNDNSKFLENKLVE